MLSVKVILPLRRRHLPLLLVTTLFPLPLLRRCCAAAIWCIRIMTCTSCFTSCFASVFSGIETKNA